MRVWPVIVACVLLSSTALAQDGLRSASLPERTASNPIPADRADQFRARPDTYTTRPMAPPTGGFTYFAIAPSPVVVIIERVVERRPAIYRREPDPEPRREPANVDRPSAAPVTPPSVAIPKTFYVIPGCYAGDRRPEPEQLPAGCDPRRLRVVPPVLTSASRR